jgi:hypothetical protein
MQKSGRKVCSNDGEAGKHLYRVIWAAWLSAVFIAPMGTLPHLSLRNACFDRVLPVVSLRGRAPDQSSSSMVMPMPTLTSPCILIAIGSNGGQ